MPNNEIMVLEKDEERIKQIGFLLRLAAYEGRVVADIGEAVNWARLSRQAGDETLCLLINSVATCEEAVNLLQQLADYAFTLPVILVKRDGWDGSIPTSRFPTLRILSCLPATINAALSAISQAQPRSGVTLRQVSA